MFRARAAAFCTEGSERGPMERDREVDRTEETQPWFRACAAAFLAEGSGRGPMERDREVDRTEEPRT